MSTRKTTLFYAVLIALASVAVGMVIASQWGLPQASSAQTINVPAANTAALNGPIDAQTFRNIAKAQSPTVVNIRTTARVRGRELTEFFGGQDDLLQRFFGGQGQPPGPGQQRPRGRQPRENEAPQQEGTGTGFIIDKSGFILTNNHVVEGADDIRVSLFGGGRTESYAAKVVGRDALTDTALIQLTEMPAAALQEAKFGDSAQMQPGDWVVAIGNPFNLSHTVTVGVVSALGRPLGGVRGREQPMLQTDAAINPGQLGRPAAERARRGRRHQHRHLHRRAAGGEHRHRIRHPDQPDSRPAAAAAQRQGHARRDRHPRRPGWRRQGRRRGDGAAGAGGAMLSSVIPGGPAEKAGLEAGDIITEFNGRPVADSDALVNLVIATKPGTSVPVTIYRKKQKKTMNVTVDELDLEAEQGRQASGRTRAGRGADRDRLRHGSRTDHP